jgi:hypothetical protein
MTELDIDRDGKLGIDEFVALMSCGDQLSFRSEASAGAYRRLKRARRLNPRDFLESFKHMPAGFAPSFVQERWKAGQNLPSSVFRAQVDPETMLWKDVLPPQPSESLPADLAKLAKELPRNVPQLRPITSSAGCSITLVSASGVPLPALGAGEGGGAFKDEFIVKRAIRVAIAHDQPQPPGLRGEAPQGPPVLVHNAVQVPATWRKADEDIWKFDSNSKEKSLRTLLFRTTPGDRLDGDEGRRGGYEAKPLPGARLLLELVVYVQQGGKKTGKDGKVKAPAPMEMSCGWCELPVKDLRAGTLKLRIQGGTPGAGAEISKEDVRSGRTGLSFVTKVLTRVESCLEVEVTPLLKLSSEVQYHLAMLPSTCLVHRPLLYLASGFMNYKATVLLAQSGAAPLRRPPGDVLLSSFTRIYDSPDIVEELATIWTEDHQPALDKSKRAINPIVERTKEVISRLYPVLYSDAFKALEQAGSTAPSAVTATSTQTAAGDPDLLELRKKLV